MSFLCWIFLLVDSSVGLLGSGKIKINTTGSVLLHPLSHLYDIPISVDDSDGSEETFPCLCGRRSSPRPAVAEDVTLQDIDILGAIGDSYTAAFAANSRGLDYFTEYWGTSFVTGEM